MQYLVLPSLQGESLCLSAHAEAWHQPAVLAQSSNMPLILLIGQHQQQHCSLPPGTRQQQSSIGRQLELHFQLQGTVCSACHNHRAGRCNIFMAVQPAGQDSWQGWHGVCRHSGVLAWSSGVQPSQPCRVVCAGTLMV